MLSLSPWQIYSPEVVAEADKLMGAETIKEAEVVRTEIKKHWRDISYLTNVYFENEKEAAIWLDKVIGCLKA